MSIVGLVFLRFVVKETGKLDLFTKGHVWLNFAQLSSQETLNVFPESDMEWKADVRSLETIHVS